MSNRADITVILDRSGSMESCKTDTIGGFNAFIKKQKSTGIPTSVTLVQFDSIDPYYVIWNATPINLIDPLTETTYTPRGLTPLLDAFGKGIQRTGERLRNMPESERPSSVIFVVITDGLENASTKYSRKDIFDMVTHQREKYNWQFVFLGANQDAIHEAAQYNIPQMAAMSYDTGSTKQAFRSMANLVGRASATMASVEKIGFTDADREESIQGTATKK